MWLNSPDGSTVQFFLRRPKTSRLTRAVSAMAEFLVCHGDVNLLTVMQTRIKYKYKYEYFSHRYKYLQVALLSQRPRDASCLSVVSFVASIVLYLKRSFLLLVTSASDWLVHTIRFCSVVFSITSSLAVIYTRSIVIVYSVWLPGGEKILKISLFVLTWSTNVTDGWTDTAWRHRPRLCIASRAKNYAPKTLTLTLLLLQKS